MLHELVYHFQAVATARKTESHSIHLRNNASEVRTISSGPKSVGGRRTELPMETICRKFFSLVGFFVLFGRFCGNKGSSCNTIASVALVHTSVQSD